MEAAQQRLTHDPSSGIAIRDPGDAGASGGPSSSDPDAGMQADMDMARRLQAKLDVQQARGGPR